MTEPDPRPSTDRPDALPPEEPDRRRSSAERSGVDSTSIRRRAGAIAVAVRWLLLAGASGVLAGLASAAFLEALDRATELRLDHRWLVWLLPAAGLVVGLVHHHLGGRAVRGNELLLEEIHEPTAWVPRRMAPLVFGGTVLSHLVGASVGREGAALQMSGSLTDLLARGLRLEREDRRLLLVAALAGGFGSVFGVPWAGAVFALEVQSVPRMRRRAAIPALVASFVGDRIVHLVGVHHAVRPQLHVALTFGLLWRVAVAGVAFGAVAAAFTASVRGIKAAVGATVRWPPARPVVGGLATLGLVALAGRSYLGLSLPLIDHALAGHDPGWSVFALKILFTVVALGCGFPGGEVTPLFVIGATLGAALGAALGVPAGALAAVGFVAVFAGAAKTPAACTVMAVELFGVGAAAPAAVACAIALACSGPHGIYGPRRRPTPAS